MQPRCIRHHFLQSRLWRPCLILRPFPFGFLPVNIIISRFCLPPAACCGSANHLLVQTPDYIDFPASIPSQPPQPPEIACNHEHNGATTNTAEPFRMPRACDRSERWAGALLHRCDMGAQWPNIRKTGSMSSRASGGLRQHSRA